MSSAAGDVAGDVSTDSPRDAASGNAIRWCTTPASSPPALRSSASASRARRVFVLARFRTNDAPDGRASELLADLVGLVERLERLGDRPEVERARLDRQDGDVGGDGGALRDVAEATAHARVRAQASPSVRVELRPRPPTSIMTSLGLNSVAA